jgi:aspartyl protease family protein
MSVKPLAISVLGTAALVAFVAPRDEGHSGPAPRRAQDAASPQLGMATRPQGFGGEMMLDREGDGHFYANVSVDGGDFRMLVDTGATVVALTGEDARAMGLDWDADALAPVARGASGPIMGVSATIPQMEVGDFEVRNVQAIIVPEGLPISLLGQSFLEHVPKVEIAGDTLTLSS